MKIIIGILKFIIGLVDTLLPDFSDLAIFEGLDSAISMIVYILQTVAYFLPVDTLLLCFTVIFVTKNRKLLLKIAKWVINLVRG